MPDLDLNKLMEMAQNAQNELHKAQQSLEQIEVEGLAGGGLLLLAGIVTLLAIFVSWAIGGFGELSHEYATAIGFTLVALGLQVILGSFFLSLLTMRTTDPSQATIVERVPVA